MIIIKYHNLVDIEHHSNDKEYLHFIHYLKLNYNFHMVNLGNYMVNISHHSFGSSRVMNIRTFYLNYYLHLNIMLTWLRHIFLYRFHYRSIRSNISFTSRFILYNFENFIWNKLYYYKLHQ